MNLHWIAGRGNKRNGGPGRMRGHEAGGGGALESCVGGGGPPGGPGETETGKEFEEKLGHVLQQLESIDSRGPAFREEMLFLHSQEAASAV
ncbi:hypothetical protein NDU88_000739 [Pleurodeles waltl]|uniref:Uncharacterized protein n=1 Tax=Pleurodeles waltl TaxID=8319 RepID=A0AAV7LVL8_PLEWA|nr:hypothetical protein NDU88_000739 [Pleurodeles waltl]